MTKLVGVGRAELPGPELLRELLNGPLVPSSRLPSERLFQPLGRPDLVFRCIPGPTAAPARLDRWRQLLMELGRSVAILPHCFIPAGEAGGDAWVVAPFAEGSALTTKVTPDATSAEKLTRLPALLADYYLERWLARDGYIIDLFARQFLFAEPSGPILIDLDPLFREPDPSSPTSEVFFADQAWTVSSMILELEAATGVVCDLGRERTFELLDLLERDSSTLQGYVARLRGSLESSEPVSRDELHETWLSATTNQ